MRRRERQLTALVVAGVFVIAQGVLLSQATGDPFAFFRPSISQGAEERRAMSKGEAVVRVLPGRDREVAVFAAVPVNVDGDRLVAWVRNIAELKRSPFVLAIGRFSEPPRMEDLRDLALDDDDLEEIRRCRPRDCGVKLGAGELGRLQRTIAGAEGQWKPRVQDAFRDVLLQRIQMYTERGHPGLSPYDDHDEPVVQQTAFSSIIRRSPYLTEGLPQFAAHLDRYPEAPMPGVESFIYWAKEQFGGKPVISATHVTLLRPGDGVLPDALVAGKQIFATHYMNGSLALTAIMRGGAGSPHYLVYLNRSEVDVVGGFWGGLVRLVVERRLKAEASEVLQGVRKRLESGDPPR